MRRSIAPLLLLSVLWLTSCGPKPESTSPIERPPAAVGVAPSHLTASAVSQGAELRWQTNQPENRILSGYNVYMAREDGEFEKITASPYPGDLDPDYVSESFQAAGLDNGVRYRFRVSTVYPNEVELFCSDTVEIIPRPQGRIRLNSSFSKEDAGFSFARLQSVPTDDLSNDMYLAIINDQAHLASPQRIDIVLRQTRYFPILRRSGDISETLPTPTGNGKELLPVKVGDQLYILTQDSCYALVLVENINLKDESLELTFVYQTRPKTLIF